MSTGMRTLCSLAWCLGAGICLTAQGTSKPPEKGLDLDDIINTDQIQAASKKVQDAASAPADVVVLRSGELRALGYRTLGEAVAGVVGFRINDDHAYLGLGVRGLYVLGDQNTRVLVLLDGHALNSPAEVGSSKIGEDFGLPMELVDRIEIVRGPASSLYGNNAFQALINVVSVDAAETRHTPFQGAVTAGTGGRSEVWVNGGAHVGAVGLSMMATGFQRTGAERTYPELRPEPMPAGHDREERQSLYLRAKGNTWSFSTFMLSRTQRLASAPYYHVVGDPASMYRNRLTTGEFRWEPRTENVKWMVRLFGDHNAFDDAFHMESASNGRALWAYDWDPDRSLGLEIQGRAQVTERFSLTFGTERRHHRFTGHAFVEGEDGDSEVRQDVSYWIGNTYAEGQFDATEHLAITLGLQGAEWRPVTLRTHVGDRSMEMARLSIRRLTPRMTLNWKPGESNVFKFIYGQGFRFPTLFERYYTDGAEDLQTYRANPALAPEVIHSEQVLWACKWHPRLRSQVAASLFQWDRQIQATLIPGAGGEGVQQFQNAATAIHGRALEGEVAWRVGTTELSGGVGWYQWQRAGLNVGNVATWQGNLKVIHRQGSWSVAGEARHHSRRENPATGSHVPANVTLRGSVRYETLGFWAQLTGEDLVNRRSKDLVAGEYRPITSMEGEGRRASLTLGMRF